MMTNDYDDALLSREHVITRTVCNSGVGVWIRWWDVDIMMTRCEEFVKFYIVAMNINKLEDIINDDEWLSWCAAVVPTCDHADSMFLRCECLDPVMRCRNCDDPQWGLSMISHHWVMSINYFEEYHLLRRLVVMMCCPYVNISSFGLYEAMVM